MAATTTTATQQEKPLRKRMRVLERAQSFPGLNKLGARDVLPDIKLKHKESGDEVPSSPLTEYESHSESSDEEHSTGEENHSAGRHKTRRPTVDTTQTRRNAIPKEHSPMSPTSRAWYEFDLAVVVALVSPIGNWLTGGDHVKNLLLILLLIFYLHQVIEIPWSLYQRSRARTRTAHLPAVADPNSLDARHSQLAASELQKLEFLFLFLTFISPLIGATLLRYATDAILGPDAVSWFSTGLFVLATGIRPWSHLVDRLSQRTEDLHDFVHCSSSQGVAAEEHKALEKRVAQLEKALGKIKTKVTNTTEDVYEYVDDAVDAVEHAMRKRERKWDRCEGKVKEVEQVVEKLSSAGAPGRRMDTIRKLLSADIGTFKVYLRSILDYTVPRWVISLAQRNEPDSYNYGSAPAPSKSASRISPGKQLTASGSKIPMRSLSGHSSPTSPLETIFEGAPLYIRDQSSREHPSLLLQPYYMTTGLLYRIGYLVTTPLRSVTRLVAGNR